MVYLFYPLLFTAVIWAWSTILTSVQRAQRAARSKSLQAAKQKQMLPPPPGQPPSVPAPPGRRWSVVRHSTVSAITPVSKIQTLNAAPSRAGSVIGPARSGSVIAPNGGASQRNAANPMGASRNTFMLVNFAISLVLFILVLSMATASVDRMETLGRLCTVIMVGLALTFACALLFFGTSLVAAMRGRGSGPTPPAAKKLLAAAVGLASCFFVAAGVLIVSASEPDKFEQEALALHAFYFSFDCLALIIILLLFAKSVTDSLTLRHTDGGSNASFWLTQGSLGKEVGSQADSVAWEDEQGQLAGKYADPAEDAAGAAAAVAATAAALVAAAEGSDSDSEVSSRESSLSDAHKSDGNTDDPIPGAANSPPQAPEPSPAEVDAGLVEGATISPASLSSYAHRWMVIADDLDQSARPGTFQRKLSVPQRMLRSKKLPSLNHPAMANLVVRTMAAMGAGEAGKEPDNPQEIKKDLQEDQEAATAAAEPVSKPEAADAVADEIPVIPPSSQSQQTGVASTPAAVPSVVLAVSAGSDSKLVAHGWILFDGAEDAVVPLGSEVATVEQLDVQGLSFTPPQFKSYMREAPSTAVVHPAGSDRTLLANGWILLSDLEAAITTDEVARVEQLDETGRSFQPKRFKSYKKTDSAEPTAPVAATSPYETVLPVAAMEVAAGSASETISASPRPAMLRLPSGSNSSPIQRSASLSPQLQGRRAARASGASRASLGALPEHAAGLLAASMDANEDACSESPSARTIHHGRRVSGAAVASDGPVDYKLPSPSLAPHSPDSDPMSPIMSPSLASLSSVQPTFQSPSLGPTAGSVANPYGFSLHSPSAASRPLAPFANANRRTPLPSLAGSVGSLSSPSRQSPRTLSGAWLRMGDFELGPAALPVGLTRGLSSDRQSPTQTDSGAPSPSDTPATGSIPALSRKRSGKKSDASPSSMTRPLTVDSAFADATSGPSSPTSTTPAGMSPIMRAARRAGSIGHADPAMASVVEAASGRAQLHRAASMASSSSSSSSTPTAGSLAAPAVPVDPTLRWKLIRGFGTSKKEIDVAATEAARRAAGMTGDAAKFKHSELLRRKISSTVNALERKPSMARANAHTGGAAK